MDHDLLTFRSAADLKDVPDGTVISNTALVSFDGGQPFSTNQTINTIVTKAPCYTKDVYENLPGECLCFRARSIFCTGYLFCSYLQIIPGVIV
ncbi:MAG: hypothetical protein IPJ13_01645 [Saprospiraceae bacterium]|nr:hypothetical protein [Saprospiraceae bacterium]